MSKASWKRSMAAVRAANRPASPALLGSATASAEPTDEQLVNFVSVSIYGAGCTTLERLITRAMLARPHEKAKWLRIHAKVQKGMAEL